MEQKDYYDILGLKNDSSQKQIRDAYRRPAFLNHLDRNKGNPEAEGRMNISKDRGVLSEE